MNETIRAWLVKEGADFVRFVDISGLSDTQTMGFPSAVLFGVGLSKEFVRAVQKGLDTPRDEFVDAEHSTDVLADRLAEYIAALGYRAFSQSEGSNVQAGGYDEKTQSMRLPHKTIACLAGWGFIGKNNLLISENYGCAFSMCTVLTDAPVTPEGAPIVENQCGDCDVCKQVCAAGAIVGAVWTEGKSRADIVDVAKCNCPLMCMVNCPYTRRYAGVE